MKSVQFCFCLHAFIEISSATIAGMTGLIKFSFFLFLMDISINVFAYKMLISTLLNLKEQ